MKENLKKYMKENNIEMSEEQIEKLIFYKENLLEWNNVMNLTAIVDGEEIIVKHFLDSFSIAKYINRGNKIIDVGTGAGFPGIPISIFFDGGVDVLLLDSLNKRINFLEDTINKSNLQNISALHARAEEIGKQEKYREVFDIATARAVANLKVLSEYMLPFVKIGGYMLAMKGTEIEEELKEAEEIISQLGGKIEKIEKIQLPLEIKHTIIVIKKIKNTPQKYPRKQSEIKKKSK